jgi:polyhydroxybutyrate depolymerase
MVDRMRWASCLLLATMAGIACGGDGDGGPAHPVPDAAVDAASPDASVPTTFGGERPAELRVPAGYDPSRPTPLVIALHGYSEFNTYVAGVLRLDPNAGGYLLISPSGTRDEAGKYFWNATDACCNFFGSMVDDVAYLNRLIDEIGAAYNVDPRRIYVVGHSNGGFMAYRFACASAGRIAAVISVAGATFDDAAACAPSMPVNVLQVHGTADSTILPDGGSIMVQGSPRTYPSAVGTVARWASYNGCAATTASGGDALDVTGDEMAETTRTQHDDCPTGGSVELWSVANAPHLITVKAADRLWTWMSAHSRP